MRAGEGLIVDCASAGGVKGHGVFSVIIDTFEDVDFPTIGPIRTVHPKGGPGAANTSGHVAEVKYDKAVIVLLVALDTNGISSG